ncbi:universal stress protein [Streptomyces sp. NPDC055992]|uniref:universal stress protein n=1 Tax=Streptomyces sp. NPDC055992 TaxID=3345673 RepID=UPI0035DA90DD
MRQRIVVGVSGSPGSLAALHRAVIEAQERDAALCAVLAWQLPGGGLGSRTAHGPDLLRECEEAAVGELCAVLSGAFAVAKPCVPLSALAMRGEPGAVLVEAAESTDDLLVVGTGARRRLLPGLRAPAARYCLTHAVCPVLVVPPNPLEAELAAVRGKPWSVPWLRRERAQHPHGGGV